MQKYMEYKYIPIILKISIVIEKNLTNKQKFIFKFDILAFSN